MFRGKPLVMMGFPVGLNNLVVLPKLDSSLRLNAKRGILRNLNNVEAVQSLARRMLGRKRFGEHGIDRE